MAKLLIKADIFGTLSHWQCGAIAGGHAARNSDTGTRCPRINDFEPGTPIKYIEGYFFGWEDSPYTVKEVRFGRSGPSAPVWVRGYNSKTAMMRANRDRQCKGA